jgi:hypothetical protein
MVRKIKTIFADAGGSEIAEAALVLPLAFMILLGIYWFGRALASTCAICGNVPPVNSPTGINNIGSQVGQAMQASGLDPTLATAPAVSYTACGGGAPTCQTPNGSGDPQISICSNVQLVASPPTASGGPSCGVAIDFQYPYQMGLPFTSLNGAPIKLSAHVQMRAEQ